MSDVIYELFESVHTPHYSNADGAQRIADRVDVHRFDHRPELEGARIVIFGVPDGRRSGDNEGCAEAAQAVREWLYRLTPHRGWETTVDLGNLRTGITENDTAAAVRTVMEECLALGLFPIVIGGGQDLTVPMYESLAILGNPANLVTIDAQLDFGADPDNRSSRNFMNDIILHEPNYLFDYTNIGHQGYLTDPDTLELLDQLQFEAIRLGEATGNLTEMEPLLRDADLVSMDLGSIRAADHPAHTAAGPNGIDAMTACALARYAGMSDRLKAFGLFEHNPDLDDRGRGAHLVAQVVWHIMEGVFNQKADYPKCAVDEYLRYIVDLEDVKHQITFLKSPRSDRWWMEIPIPTRGNAKKKHYLAACSYDTYLTAASGKIPDRWWRILQKLG